MKEQADGFVGAIKSVLSIFYDKNDRFHSGKCLSMVFIVLCFLGYWHRTDLSEMIVSTATESIEKRLSDEWYAERDVKFEEAMKEQINSVYLATFPDIAGVFIYDPTDNPEVESLRAFQGVLPTGTTIESWKRKGIDRSSEEYINHQQWIPYYTTIGLEYFTNPELLLKHKDEPWQFSCPIYSIDSMYMGYIGLNWNKAPVALFNDYEYFMKKLYTTCTFAARKIGVFHATDGETW